MKRSVIIVSAVILGIMLGGGIYILRVRGKAQPQSAAPAPSPSPAAPETKTWKDPAGFSLAYPADLTLNKHDEDQVNYAHLEFTHKDHPGSLIVWAKDLPAGVVDGASWVKKEKSFAGSSVVDGTLGGQPAKKIALSNPKRLVVGTVYDELLWYLDVLPKDEAYWLKVADGISGSFAFTPASDTSSGQSSDESGGYAEEAVDEEEVIE